eukprot:COSAG05_NODE_29_length_29038_cov_1237.466985_4_plen_88_part_00
MAVYGHGAHQLVGQRGVGGLRRRQPRLQPPQLPLLLPQQRNRALPSVPIPPHTARTICQVIKLVNRHNYLEGTRAQTEFSFRHTHVS